MKLPLFWVDAFTDRVFSGNPAAVIPLDAWLPDATMQQIAFENGLSETAFFVRTGADRFHLRWFSPPVEIDLCGHATLASAFVLFRQLGITASQIVFDSRSGPLTVRRRADDKLELDFPATPPAPETDRNVIDAVADALGQSPQWIGRSRFDLLAVLRDAEAVRTLKPDFARVSALGGRGLIVTAQGDATCDFVSRFFAPQTGIPEDPVTGSAHCALLPYWSERLGRTTLHARQVSKRGGELWCDYARAGATSAEDRVKIAGRAVLYLRGEIDLADR